MATAPGEGGIDGTAEPTSETSVPSNYRGTIDSLRTLKMSRSPAYGISIGLIRALLDGSKKKTAESGYEGWSDDNLRAVLRELEEENEVPASGPEQVNLARETELRDQLLLQLETAMSLEDLARVKKGSLDLDLSTGYFKQVEQAIIARFKVLLIAEVRKLP